MRNLFTFLWKHRFVFWFLILEMFAFYLIIQNNYYQQSIVKNVSSRFTGSLMNYYNSTREYFSLKEANRQLVLENARLHHLTMNTFIIGNTTEFQIGDSLFSRQFTYHDAKVIRNSVKNRNNYLMLDKGLKFDVSEDMGVISPDGIVGIVKSSSKNFSSVISILHEKTNISVMLLKNGQKGSLTWDGKDYRIGIISGIPANFELFKGDTIVTSPNSALFPEGIMVGTVDDYDIDKGVNFFNIKTRFSVDYNKLHYVYIIKNIMKNEQLELEKQNSNE